MRLRPLRGPEMVSDPADLVIRSAG
jgi:hypothetical protein